MFWRSEQIRGTNKPEERATTPSGAFSRGFLEQAAGLQNGGMWNSQSKRENPEATASGAFRTGFVNKGAEHGMRTSNSSQLLERTLCATSDDAENGTWTSNSIKFAEQRSLWSEQQRQAERFPVDFLTKRANLGNAWTRRIYETDDFQNEYMTLFLRNGRIAERTLCRTSNDHKRSVFPPIP